MPIKRDESVPVTPETLAKSRAFLDFLEADVERMNKRAVGLEGIQHAEKCRARVMAYVEEGRALLDELEASMKEGDDDDDVSRES